MSRVLGADQLLEFGMRGVGSDGAFTKNDARFHDLAAQLVRCCDDGRLSDRVVGKQTDSTSNGPIRYPDMVRCLGRDENWYRFEPDQVRYGPGAGVPPSRPFEINADWGWVGSGRGAVLTLRPVRFPDPPAEPGVRVSTHRALHVS